MKPLCKFCGGRHDTDEEHPEEAVREALAELRRTEPPVSEFAVGRRTLEEVREHVERVTKPPVTSPEPVVTPPSEPVTKATVTKSVVTKGRPRIENPSAEALRRRKYRERREA